MLNLRARLSSFLKGFTTFRKINYFYKKEYSKYKIFDSLTKNSVFLDLGANVGRVSQYVNDVSDGCKIFCYEPHPGAIQELKKLFLSKSNVKIIEKAVSNIDGKQRLYFHENSKNVHELHGSQSTSLVKEKNNIDSSNFINIETVSLEKVLSEHDFVDFIKIDIEGAEYDLLPDLIKNKDKIGKVACELHGKILPNGKNPQPFFNKHYIQAVGELKNLGLYGKWFLEW